MTSPLDRLAALARARAQVDREREPLERIEAILRDLPVVRPFRARLEPGAGPWPRVVAEMKRRSPSAGELRRDYHPRQIAMGYARVGAAALSVLTEPSEFGGDLAHVAQARPAHLPILRKDFIVSAYQIAQARVAGADAVLLIAGILPGADLAGLIAAAASYGIEAVVEAHDEQELQRALDAGAGMIGINNRDLRTMQTDLATCERLAPRVPAGILKIAESGIRSRTDLERLAAAGYGAFLVGEPLMRADDPADELWRLIRPSS